MSLHPPWTTIFKGERVTLRCDGYHPLLLELRPISTLWYLGHLLLPSHKKSIEVQTPGVYRCQTRGAPVSDPIHLSVSNGECLSVGEGQHTCPLVVVALLWGRTLGHSHWGRKEGVILSLWGQAGTCLALCERCSKSCVAPKVPYHPATTDTK